MGSKGGTWAQICFKITWYTLTERTSAVVFLCSNTTIRTWHQIHAPSRETKHWCLCPHQFAFGISVLFILAGYPIPMFSCSHSEEYFVNLVKISPEATYAHCFLSLPNIFVRRVGWTNPVPSTFLHVPSSPTLSSSWWPSSGSSPIFSFSVLNLEDQCIEETPHNKVKRFIN